MSQALWRLSKLWYLSLGSFLVFTGVILFSGFSGYWLQTNYTRGLTVLTILFAVGAIWQKWRSKYDRLSHWSKSQLLVLFRMLATSLLVIVIGYYLLVTVWLFTLDDCHISYTSPSHQRTITIRDRCFFDCDSYLYLQWLIFEKEIAKIVDSSGGFCRAHESNQTRIQWSADEHQIEWKIQEKKGIVRLE